MLLNTLISLVNEAVQAPSYERIRGVDALRVREVSMRSERKSPGLGAPGL